MPTPAAPKKPRARKSKAPVIPVPAAFAGNPLLEHYLSFSQYTYPGLYAERIAKDLPDEVEEIGYLVRNQLTNRKVLENGRVGMEIPEVYGDMTKVPWYRQPEDDIFVTAAAMLVELYRRDPRGFPPDRAEAQRMVLTTRYVAVLTSSILKTKGIPARVRAGFAPYFNVIGGKSADHWINQYWSEKKNRWVTIDVDGSLEAYIDHDPYDMDPGVFEFAADAWLDVREGRRSGSEFWNAANHEGLMVICWELFYDYHCVMNSEIIYLHVPEFIYQQFDKLTEDDLREIDELARMMQEPDTNFVKLKEIWDTEKKYRILRGGLL